MNVLNNLLSKSYLNQINKLNYKINKSNQHISSGLRINSAADDPSTILRLNRATSQINGARIGQKNIQDSMSMLQLIDDVSSNIKSMSQKLRDLSTSYNNPTLSNDDKAAIVDEATSIINQIGSYFKNTTFNEECIFSKNKISIQTGANTSDITNINISLPESLSNITSILESTQLNNTSNLTKYKIDIPEYDTSLLESYKNYSGDIKIFDNNNNVFFEGSLKNGNFDGFGKLYENGQLKYSGTWTAGSINGYGTLFDENGNTEYEGYTNNGVLDGYGKYYENGNITFAGFFKDGYRQGWGELTTENESIQQYFNDYDYALSLSSDSTPFWLNTDYIDKNILEPLNKYQINIGNHMNNLQNTLDIQSSLETINSNYVSNMQDADMAKELMEKSKNEILLQANIALLSQNIEDDKSYILQLLN
jgi:flagellin